MFKPFKSTAEGIATEYSINVNEFESSVQQKCNELRILLRSKQNLEDAYERLSIVEESFNKRCEEHKNQIIYSSLFAHAIVLYGSCFTMGGSPRGIPLEPILPGINDDMTHNEIMRHRHKFISHLDDNNELRTDELLWTLKVSPNGLIPGGHYLRINKLLFSTDSDKRSWINHIAKLIELVDNEINNYTLEINKIVSGLDLKI